MWCTKKKLYEATFAETNIILILLLENPLEVFKE